MNAEFNWWLLFVGLVVGAGLVWLILADSSRREVDVKTRERASEARWIATQLREGGRPVDEDAIADVLDLHALYLSAPPPDDPVEHRTPANPEPETPDAADETRTRGSTTPAVALGQRVMAQPTAPVGGEPDGGSS